MATQLKCDDITESERKSQKLRQMLADLRVAIRDAEQMLGQVDRDRSGR